MSANRPEAALEPSVSRGGTSPKTFAETATVEAAGVDTICGADIVERHAAPKDAVAWKRGAGTGA